ncbi:MAG: HAMP domain-containing histidine kinase [Anaerolineales bacterium]|nr:HAMP domain-containing histidine kinase [Anaerolineales bacterium]
MSEELVAQQALKKAFPGIPDYEIDKLLTTGALTNYPPGIDLCKEGAKEDIFYVILDGEVEVSKLFNDDEVRIMNRLGAGDFFGEMGIIHNAPRAATVTTTSDGAFLEIHKAAFEEALSQSSSVSLAMVREVSRRLRENDEIAIEDLRVKAGELATAYQQLAELDLARRELLTTIAHELRTPLTAASGFLQVVRMGMMEGEALQSALDTIARNIERIVSLTNDILFLQEVDLILSDFEEVNVGALVRQAAQVEQVFADESGIMLNLDIEPGLKSIQGDEKSLVRAFTAILNNAIKYSTAGSEVDVTVKAVGDCTEVQFVDCGIGIPEYALSKIYDRFYRIEEYGGKMYDGLGLGLSIARQVIEQHEGEINAQSKVGEGSTFTVLLKQGCSTD